MRGRTCSRLLLTAVVLAASSRAHAQAPVEITPGVTLLGYVESFWQWSVQRPENRVTNYRAFDNRNDTFTLSNLALGASWDVADVVGALVLQVGHTPSTYYGSEPASPATGGANASGSELWKYVQRAHAGYRFHVASRALLVEAGIFLSPIGPESMAVHDNWHWSRSNLFFGLPFYHTGARATLSASDHWSVSVAVFNGWNSVVDANREKSLVLQGSYFPSERLTLGLLYFAGVERPDGAPEGERFRHLFDAHATLRVAPPLAVMAEVDGGFEPTRFGMGGWTAAALSLRWDLLEVLDVALRGDVFREWVAANEAGRASPLFFPAAWVSSATATLDYHPADRVSFRLEYRHDHAEQPMYFRRRVPADAAPNTRRQDTLTAGVTAWF